MIEKDDDVQDSTRERLNEAAKSSIVQLVMPGLMAVGMLFLGYAVNRLSDHFDRIDAHLAASDTSTTVLRRDMDEVKTLTAVQGAQLKEVQNEADHTAWIVGSMQHDTGGRR